MKELVVRWSCGGQITVVKMVTEEEEVWWWWNEDDGWNNWMNDILNGLLFVKYFMKFHELKIFSSKWTKFEGWL
jgi:hypothetical protein